MHTGHVREIFKLPFGDRFSSYDNLRLVCFDIVFADKFVELEIILKEGLMKTADQDLSLLVFAGV